MGSLTEKETKDFDGKPIPAEKQAYFFGVAIPKNAPGLNELIGQLWQMAATDYAQVPLVMNQINQGLAARDFAWKISDGDVQTFDQKTGQPRTIPDYLKGTMILKFRTQFEIGAWDAINGVEIPRSNIKVGDYIDVAFNATTNGKMDLTAGIYLNPVALRLLGYGPSISHTVSAASAFAGRDVVVPQGASTMPQGGMPQGYAAPQGGMPQGNGMPPAQGGMPQGNGTPPAQGGMPQGYAASQGGMPGPAGAYPTTASLAPQASPHTAILAGPQGGGMPGFATR
jgi:hypothetical protein